MAGNFIIDTDKVYQVVFPGNAYVNIDTTGIAVADIMANMAVDASGASATAGQQYYKALIEYASELGIEIAEQQICYVRDITSDPTLTPAAAPIIITPQEYALEFEKTSLLTTGTNAGGIAYAWKAGTITGVFFTRLTAGSSGSIILDVNKNGTTLYTTQGNRPTIAYDDADKAVSATLPDVVSIAQGDLITMDIDQTEGGSPTGPLRLWVRIRPSI